MAEHLRQGLLIVVSGPSGVGKDCVLDGLLSGSDKFERSVSATTRSPRDGETDGVDYSFVSRDEFADMIHRGDMLEYTEYNGNMYGTLKRNVEKILNDGKNVIMKIEVEGALNVKRLYPESVLVFIAPPSWSCLEQRLRGRATETGKNLECRLEIAKFELSRAGEYDYIIINDFVELCAKRLEAIITAEGCSSSRMNQFINNVTQI